MTRFLSTGIRAPDLGGPVPETLQAAAKGSESEWEKSMKRLTQKLKDFEKLVKKTFPRRRRLPVWENNEARWWRRRRRSSMEDWPPNIRAFLVSMQVEEEEDEDSKEGLDLIDFEQDEVREAVADHHLQKSDLVEDESIEEEEVKQEDVEEEEDENEEEGMDLSKYEEEYHTKLEMGMMTEEESPAVIKREVTFAVKDVETTEPVGGAMVVTLDLKEVAETAKDVRWSPAHQQRKEEKLATVGEILIPEKPAKLSSSELL